MSVAREDASQDFDDELLLLLAEQHRILVVVDFGFSVWHVLCRKFVDGKAHVSSVVRRVSG